jgi:uncharacterized SAM-binding protein YcdF (DUF218 family)
MLIALKTLLRTLVLPPCGPLLLAFAGAWLLARHPGRRARRAGITLLALGLGSLWLLATPAVAMLAWRAAEREPALDLNRATAAQAIVILATGTHRPAAPEYGDAPAAGGDLLERLAYGAYLARRTRLPVLVSGTDPEAQAMLTSLSRDFGVPTRWVENHSRDTFENAQLSAPILRDAGITRILLVTSASHAYRAAHEFEATGLTVLPAPTGLKAPLVLGPGAFVPQAGALRSSAEALYELLGDAARAALAALHLRRHSN